MTRSIRSYLELAQTLTVREIIVRYKRSAFGVVWALADPALHVVVYLLTFGAILDAGRGVASYPLFTLLGVLPWLFFSTTLDHSAGVLIEHALLIRKLSFPTELLVISVAISRLTTLLIGVLLTLAVAVVLGLAGSAHPAWERAPFVLVGLVLLTMFAIGLSLVAAAVGVVFGDAQFLVRFALRIGFFACPIVYPITRVPDLARPLYELNPLVGMLWCFQGVSDASLQAPSMTSWLAAVAGAVGGVAAGWLVFSRLRGVVAELV